MIVQSFANKQTFYLYVSSQKNTMIYDGSEKEEPVFGIIIRPRRPYKKTMTFEDLILTMLVVGKK